MCYLKFWNFLTFSNPSPELLIWNFQMRLQTIYSIWYVWNLKLFKHVMGVAYLKLSDETWNEMCYLKLLKLETFQTHHGELLIWNLKLSDETWNEMCYLKFWNFITFSNPSQELLIWNFQMRLETIYSIWYVWNLKLLQTCYGSCLFETFRWDLKKSCYLKFLKLVTFQTHHGELLIWNFQMRLEIRCAIWNFWNLKLCSLKLFETFDMPFEDKKVSINPEFRKDQLLAHRVDICHSFICHSLTFIWMLSAVMFVFLTTLIMLNIVSIKVCFYQSLI